MAQRRKPATEFLTDSESDFGPRGPVELQKAALAAVQSPEDPEVLSGLFDSGVYKPQAGDKALVLRLGDCRLCQHRQRRSAELILGSVVSGLYQAIKFAIDAGNVPRLARLPTTIPTPAVFREIQTSFGWTPTGNAFVGWLPAGWLSAHPDSDAGSGASKKITPDEFGEVALSAIVHYADLWKRSKTQQRDCCLDKTLRQLPGARKVIRPNPIIPQLKKKIRINERRNRILPNPADPHGPR